MLEIERFQAARARQEMHWSEIHEDRLSLGEMESSEAPRWQRIEKTLLRLLHRGTLWFSRVELRYASN